MQSRQNHSSAGRSFVGAALLLSLAFNAAADDATAILLLNTQILMNQVLMNDMARKAKVASSSVVQSAIAEEDKDWTRLARPQQPPVAPPVPLAPEVRVRAEPPPERKLGDIRPACEKLKKQLPRGVANYDEDVAAACVASGRLPPLVARFDTTTNVWLLIPKNTH